MHHTKSNHHNKKKIGVYASSKHTNIPFCEQIAIIFDILQKKVVLSEELYEKKEFEKAYHIVKNNINIASSLCDLLMSATTEGKPDDDAKKWQHYFTALMQSFVLLSSNHNKKRMEKILEELKSMSSLWRKRGEVLQEKSAIRNIIKESMMHKPDVVKVSSDRSSDTSVFLDV